MNEKFKDCVSLYEDNNFMFSSSNSGGVVERGVVKIIYDVNKFVWGTPRGGEGTPFSEKIPESLYNHIGYDRWGRDYTYKNNTISQMYLSSNRKKVFIDCEGSREYDYIRKTYLIDTKSGNVLFMHINTHFHSAKPIIYNDNLYFFLKTNEGFIVFDENFNDALHDEAYRKVRGDIYSDCYIYNFFKGKYQIFDLEKKLLFRTDFQPCKTIGSSTARKFMEKDLLFTIDKDLYSLVDLTKNEVIAKDFYIDSNLHKPGDKVYDRNLNILTLDKNIISESSNIELSNFITEGNEINDLKIYVDKNDKVRIAEMYDIPIESEIEKIIDIEQGEALVLNGKKNIERNTHYNIVNFSSYFLKNIKVIYKNGNFNIYEKGKGWEWNDEYDGMI